MRTDLADVTMPEGLVVELTQLTGYRTDVMADWVRGINRLRSLLGSIFPALEAAFDYSTRPVSVTCRVLKLARQPYGPIR
jgi:hypothetical protein